METMPDCLPCHARPHGDRGHVDLRERGRFGRCGDAPDGCAVYSCSLCASLWERRTLRRGSYLWILRAAGTPAIAA